jgi:hypothetical protein
MTQIKKARYEVHKPDHRHYRDRPDVCDAYRYDRVRVRRDRATCVSSSLLLPFLDGWIDDDLELDNKRCLI